MNEPTPARAIGSEVAWTGWRPATDQAAAPRPDAVRPELAVGRGTIPGTTGSDEAKRDAPGVAATPAAVFPTSYARFAIDAETQRLSIKIVDLVTDEVIREIPSEQVQRIAEDLQAAARRNVTGKRPATGAPGTNAAASGGVDRYV